MDAVAWPLLKRGSSAIVLSDARKGEVYAAYYPASGDSALPERSGGIILIPLEDVQEWVFSIGDPDVQLIGTALPVLLQAGHHFGGAGIGEGPGAPDAECILTLGEKLYQMGRGIAPHVLVPTYVRTPDAKKPAPGSIITGTAARGKGSRI
jgi:tRNA A37 threonylcarbamoyladenosine modification protein TsaB